MSDYLRIASAYCNKVTVAVWCFLLICLLAICTSEEFARNSGGVLGGVLSRKSYMAMFAYFNACLLGVLLRGHIAHPWATLVPHYRRKHLLVAASIAGILLALPMFLMGFLGTSDVAPSSVAVIFLTCLAAGMWTLHQPLSGFLAIPFLAFVAMPASSFPALANFLEGANPVVSVVLAWISLFALGVLAWRLLTLSEGKLEYAMARLWGDLFHGRTQSSGEQSKLFHEYVAALPADQRATWKDFDTWKSSFNNLKELDGLSGCSERTLWQRMQLWRLGTTLAPTSISLGRLMLTTPLFVLPFVYLPAWMGAALPARDTVVIFSVQVMMNPFHIWLFWFMRRSRLGYESLRPRTRQEFVQELGLTLLWDLFQCWVGGVVFVAIAGAIWAPELLHWQNLLLFSFCTAAGQLAVFAMGIWPIRQGQGAGVLCTLCAFLGVALWMVSTMNGSMGLVVPVSIASLLAGVSAVVIAIACGRWCRADLD